MKKLFLFLLVGFFAVVVAACSNLPTLESISISGQDVEFYVGEEFNTGELKVVAKLSDASTEDVTSQAAVSQNANMNVAGTYTVTVEYKGLIQTYDIVVVEDTLVSVAVENAKAEYKIGEVVSFEGAKITETYVSGKVVEAAASDYKVSISCNGETYEGAFAKLGTNTVKLTKGAVSCEFDVNVVANVYTNVADAVLVGVANANKVASGNVIVDNEGYVSEYNYKFGYNFVEIQGPDTTDYYSLLENDTVFGVVSGIDWEGNEYLEAAYDPTLNNLLGADLRSVLNYTYDIFGVESLVDTLSYVGQSDEAINYTEEVNENNFKFAYEIVIDGFYYYFVKVEFVLDAEAEVFTNVNVEMKGYMFILNEETWEYEQPTEFGEPDFTRVVTATQVLGAQNAENPYPVEELLIQSFELEDEEGNKLENGATVTSGLKVALNLNVVNINPTTANTNIDQITVTVLDEYGEETYSVYGSYNFGMLSVTAYKVGTYQLVIASANVEYTLSFVVEFSPLESFVAGVYNADWWELVEADSATVYTNQVLEFGAIVNEGADAAFEVSCEGAEISEGEYYQFVAAEVGTYVITLTSKVNPEFTATITVEVTEAPSLAEILNGEYQFTSMMLGTAVYTFVPESEGALNGELTIVYKGPNVGNGEAYFSYEYSFGFLQLTPLNPGSYRCLFGAELSETYSLLCTYNGWAQGELVRPEPAAEGALSGNFTTTYPHPMNQMPMEMVLSFNVDGSGYYSLMNGMYEGSFAYVNNEGVIEFSDVFASFGTDVELAATIEGNVITCSVNFIMDGVTLDLELLGATEEEVETTTTPVVGENKVNVSYWGNEVIFTAEEAGTYTITIDDTIGCLLVESFDVWYQPIATVTLEAGESLLIVVLLNVNGEDQVATLTIALN